MKQRLNQPITGLSWKDVLEAIAWMVAAGASVLFLVTRG